MDASTSPEGAPPKRSTCDTTKPFEEPVPIGGAIDSTSSNDSAPSLTDDELRMVFGRVTPGGSSLDGTILETTRGSIDEDFGPPRELTEVNDADRKSFGPTMTGDGLVLFWNLQKNQGTGILSSVILTARRASLEGKFSAPEPYRSDAAGITHAFGAHVSHDGSELFFSAYDSSTKLQRLVRSERGNLGLYGPPMRMSELDADANDTSAALSADGLLLLFASDRGEIGQNEIWSARRATRKAPFEDIEKVTVLSSTEADRAGWLSVDGCRFYMTRTNPSTNRGTIYIATRPP
ncbi:MAG: PD40 domain-containing protein [Labilithrix sp.]|nr:PD40 domain-containing protein [Labilithrix sp.]MCW5812083.1 PD40 domain-containing protein [Labilithrix sp.]